MKFSNIKYTLIAGLLLFLTSTIQAQSLWVPQLSYNIPANSLSIEDLEIDHKNGYSIGLDYRSGSGSVFFNPGIHFFTNSADILQIDTLNAAVDPVVIGDTKHSMLKLVLGSSAVLKHIGEKSNFHLRGAFVPTFKIGSADYGDSNLDPDTQKNINLEFLFGLGFDIDKIVLDFDFHLSLLRGFEHAHEVQNSFSIALGYKI